MSKTISDGPSEQKKNSLQNDFLAYNKHFPFRTPAYPFPFNAPCLRFPELPQSQFYRLFTFTVGELSEVYYTMTKINRLRMQQDQIHRHGPETPTSI
ncbi:hypothetical protein CEXT_298891 [Caerostris extrusa]|uniref:Uncharacterized protein n=1 Tax=Caerostris extrusa TaxID=172846 RepID=A0AAV4U9W0_CAEEX|nr:hypothetical protein CEXT_298891 [Caerostris extrusa]